MIGRECRLGRGVWVWRCGEEGRQAGDGRAGAEV